MSDLLNVVVDDLYRQGRHNLSVTLVAENGQPLPDWQPGAHIDVHLRDGLIRQYSLTGRCDDARGYQILYCPRRAIARWIALRARHAAPRPDDCDFATAQPVSSATGR
ncbi:hypothetical protein E05_24540 [Plautia stali symbiont]|nr:hypothetical protein E05_24540 [Plautia stali symbiont]